MYFTLKAGEKVIALLAGIGVVVGDWPERTSRELFCLDGAVLYDAAYLRDLLHILNGGNYRSNPVALGDFMTSASNVVFARRLNEENK